jgi:hypothetical protein
MLKLLLSTFSFHSHLNTQNVFQALAMVFSPLNSDDWSYFLSDEKLFFDESTKKL